MNTEKKKLSTKDMAFAGMFAAVIVVMTQIAIPMPSGVPVTLQTFAVALAGFILGAKLGTVSTAVYVLLGAVGLPVFANHKGGPEAITGVTGGFIWGFILMALLCGLGTDSGKKWLATVLGIAGLLLCHLCGTAQFTLIKQGGFISSLMVVSLPYLIKDTISVIAALGISVVVRKRLHMATREKT